MKKKKKKKKNPNKKIINPQEKPEKHYQHYGSEARKVNH